MYLGNSWDTPEEAYTTKLDRSAPDFKEKEKKAQQIANEIMSVCNIPFVWYSPV